MCELNSSGSVTAFNTFTIVNPDTTRLISRHAGATSTFYTFDAQGNVAQRLNSAGAVVSDSVYDSYGMATTSGTAADAFGYGGQFGYYSDQSTGLILLTQRYYAPDLGRFLTRDPIGTDGGVNLYAYVQNQPMTSHDPNGDINDKLCQVICWGTGGGAAAACSLIPAAGPWGIAAKIVCAIIAEGGAALCSTYCPPPPPPPPPPKCNKHKPAAPPQPAA